ncbi:MAG TPA: GNAT family N-acetyltransferase [Micromonosporaceae bacterium]|nr:GNAT family N-acetyltransferase [Micromonosporaceae bacterium]
MGWVTTGDTDEFLAAAGGLLRSRAAQNTIILTIVDTICRQRAAGRGDATTQFGWWAAPDGTVRGTFLHTPPHPLVVAAVTAWALPDLAGMLAGAGRPISGVNATPGVAETFAEAWRQRTGAAWNVAVRMRLYRLDRLADLDPAPPGRARVAGPGDRDLLVAWMEAFAREAPGMQRNVAQVVEDRLGYGGLTLWECDGEPVAMAGVTRAVAGMVRVAPVYTPPDQRRRGYGGAVTAAVSRAALHAGVRDVVLFTDLANPTANALYQRIGFRPLEDRAMLSFTPMPVRVDESARAAAP